MMGSRIVFVHLPEDRSFVFDGLTPRGQGAFSPNLVCKGQLRPGQKADTRYFSSEAANPRVPKPKLRVVSLSPIFAGRELTW